jgi:hypothetical protein
MMATGVTPTCRYGHGDLVLAKAPGSKPNLFFVPLEASVSDIRAQVSGLSAMAANMATKSDVSSLSTLAANMATKSDVSSLSTITSHMATKADVSQLESSLIKWLVGTLLAVALLTLTIARFVKVGG